MNFKHIVWFLKAKSKKKCSNEITVTVARYDAGDHVAVYPTNDPELVEKLGSLLDVDLDTVISLNNTDGEKPFYLLGPGVLATNIL